VVRFCGAPFRNCRRPPVVLMDTFDAAEAVASRAALDHATCSAAMKCTARMLDLAARMTVPVGACVWYAASIRVGRLRRSAWQKRIPLFGLYGSTEVQALFSLQRADAPVDRRIEGGGIPAAGRRPKSVFATRIRGVAAGREECELEIRAPGQLRGLLERSPIATADSNRPMDSFAPAISGAGAETAASCTKARATHAARRIPGQPARDRGSLGSSNPRRRRRPSRQRRDFRPERCVAFVIRHRKRLPPSRNHRRGVPAKMAGFKVPARVWFVDDCSDHQSANGIKMQRGRLRETAIIILFNGIHKRRLTVIAHKQHNAMHHNFSFSKIQVSTS
jgi:fatty-acyl-CoA synthase